VLPKISPIALSDTACIIVALIVNSSSYISEIIRAGIQAVDKGQTEAAKSLGMSPAVTLRCIVLPQAIKNILPALGNQFILTVKETSLASVFFVGELMTAYKSVQSATFLSVSSLTIAGIIYLIVTYTRSVHRNRHIPINVIRKGMDHDRSAIRNQTNRRYRSEGCGHQPQDLGIC
jgi:ABC-type amino acid transport system permease subunit